MMPTYFQVGLLLESSYGVLPSAQLQLVNVSSLNLRMDRDPQRPNVLTGSRRPYPTRILRKTGNLSLPCPIQFGNDDIPLQSIMASTKGSLVTIGPADTIDFTAATGVIDSAALFGDLASGDMIFISGADVTTGGWRGTGNNGWFGPIVKTSASVITVPPGQIVNETGASGSAVTIKTKRWLDGDTSYSFSAQWNATKLTNKYRRQLGNVVSSSRFEWQQGSWASVEHTCMGQVPSYSASNMGTGANLAAPTSSFQNSVDDFLNINILDSTGAVLTQIVSRLVLDLAATRPAIYGLGDVGPSSFDLGSVAASIDGTAIYDNDSQALADAIESHETLTAVWDQVDPQGNRRCYCLPAVKPDTGDVEGGEADSEPATLPFRLNGHDPAKDADSFFNGDFSYVFGMFEVPAA